MDTYRQAAECLRIGGIIAYPTEAVYGLGCDPGNESAVQRILKLKQRSVEKGLILIAAEIDQLHAYIEPDLVTKNTDVMNSWPGPCTWIFPCKTQTPNWLTGMHSRLAVRVTAHPVAAGLCTAFGGALVSTSANPAGSEPARTAEAVRDFFDARIDMIIEGAVGKEKTVSVIRDAQTGERIR